MMNRREFLATGAAASVAALLSSKSHSAHLDHRFGLDFAPHFGMFRHLAGDDLVDQIGFMAEQGFRTVEDNGLRSKPADLQVRIGEALQKHGLQLGVFVGMADYGRSTFASGLKNDRTRIRQEMQETVEVARRVGANWCSIIPGKLDRRLSIERQTRNAIQTLRMCADLCEPAGLTMLIEPLHHGSRRPHLFLHDMPQAHAICKSVDRPGCKLLFDVYHQHLLGRSVLADVERYWDEIGYFQLGDNPGRKEPGTGDIDYPRLVRYVRERGFSGVLGMEHGNSRSGRTGERAVVDAYKRLDAC